MRLVKEPSLALRLRRLPALSLVFSLAFLSSSAIEVTVIRVMNRSIKASLRSQDTLDTQPRGAHVVQLHWRTRLQHATDNQHVTLIQRQMVLFIKANKLISAQKTDGGASRLNKTGWKYTHKEFPPVAGDVEPDFVSYTLKLCPFFVLFFVVLFWSVCYKCFPQIATVNVRTLKNKHYLLPPVQQTKGSTALFLACSCCQDGRVKDGVSVCVCEMGGAWGWFI